MTNFKLVPFRPNPLTNSLEGEFSSVFNAQKDLYEIQLIFVLTGSLKKIAWPTNQHNPLSSKHKISKDIPLRKDELWRSTCFECFLSYDELPQYFEFNFSPDGYWQSYQFSNYRGDRQLTTNLILSKSEIDYKINQTRITVNLEYVVPQFVTKTLSKKSLSLGLSVILQDLNDQQHYFSLEHNSEIKPDFHDPKSHLFKINCFS